MSGLNQRVCGSGVVHHREGIAAPAAGRRDGVLRRTANHTHHRRRFPGVPMDYWSTGWRNVVDAIGVFQTPKWSTCSVHVFYVLCSVFRGEGGALWSVIDTHVTGRWSRDVMGGKQAYAGMYICICRYEELQPAGDAVRRRTAAASSVQRCGQRR